ncbi:MAG TPA: hypothetical protein VGQ52_18430 [Gemmatimonadaceae bacterium]|jgi:hypothetical protein|nr:hypothetical protein [Gemmatimonadaceae bacterium]
MTQRSDFPRSLEGYTRSFGGAPIMLDGMEVLFDKTVGLAPVTLVPKKGTVPATGTERD